MFKTIVLIRTTTRVNHQSGIVQSNEIKRTQFQKLSWMQNLNKYITVGEIARVANPNIEIIGKKSGHFSEALEYNILIVIKTLSYATGKKLLFDYDKHLKKTKKLAEILPPVFLFFVQDVYIVLHFGRLEEL